MIITTDDAENGRLQGACDLPLIGWRCCDWLAMVSDDGATATAAADGDGE